MSAPHLQWLAQAVTGRMLNTAFEGMILAGVAWVLLRLIGRQSSRTRFAVWFAALLTTALLPFFAGSGAAHPTIVASAKVHREITLSSSWASYLFAAWAAGAAVLLLRLGVGLWQVHRLRSSCQPVDLDSLEPVSAGTVRNFNSRRPIKVCVSERVNVPAAIGFFRPAIVFPAWLLPQLSADEIQVILLHEDAHLGRGDQWTNLVQKFVKAVFFFHPAVWWIENHLTLEREMACDDIVLAQSRSPKAYASFLVSFAEKLQHARSLELVQALVSRMRQMSLRVAQILDGKRSRRTGLWAPVLAVNAALVALVLGAAPYVPQFVAFRNQPGPDRPRQIQSARIQTASEEARPAVVAAKAAVSRTVAQPAPQRSNPTPQPRVIPAAYDPRGAAVLPMRWKAPLNATTPEKAITPSKPVVVRAKAETEELPGQETFVVVQTTEYDSSGAGVWTLCIWRVRGGKLAERQIESVVAPKI
jgi:beta-lactamase regulating signal transducer with metallopeptidase domain